MKIYTFFSNVLLVSAVIFTLFACRTSDNSGNTESNSDAFFHPVPLPDTGIPGFVFPESESTILQWIENDSQEKMHKHAWGIWTGLTSPSGEVFEGQKLLVFETWYTPADILTLMSNDKELFEGKPRVPRPLSKPNQFSKNQDLLQAAESGETTVTGFVKYDPTASDFILKYNLLSKATLSSLLKAGNSAIHDFPVTAISLKPVFQTLNSDSLVDGRYYQLKVWPGPPDPPAPYGPGQWPGCIWVDIQNKGLGNGLIDTECKSNGSSRSPETTYNVTDFINFQLSEEQAKAINLSKGSATEVSMGDYSILVAMHVTSREITRWTWQTHWWTPTPDNPNFPSSKEIAGYRPDQLKGAPRNYAVSIAYSMVYPPQPNTGGKNSGESVYAFNPWLEAHFGPKVLPDSKPGVYKGKKVLNDVGVQTNCMSCHAQANYTESTNQKAPGYTGDRYVDLNDPDFSGTLKVDFLWSLPGNAK